MGQREVTILNNAVEAVADIAYFIESKGMPDAAKKFIGNVFLFLKDYPMIK